MQQLSLAFSLARLQKQNDENVRKQKIAQARHTQNIKHEELHGLLDAEPVNIGNDYLGYFAKDRGVSRSVAKQMRNNAVMINIGWTEYIKIQKEKEKNLKWGKKKK